MSTEQHDAAPYGEELASIGQHEAFLAAALRCTWALTDPGNFLIPEAWEEILKLVLSAVREDERDGYAHRLEASAEQHRERLRGCCARTGRAARPPRTAGTC
ncbi:hypothetical protein QOM21_37355 [Streptomyces sp. Pv4-95]|uniref:hypothetical protein n=1 Tax=Streptomyces sp. Pv4-95 TaxID=3049543 RepID=UPI0038927354